VILLLGGTSETAPLAEAFTAKGWPVLVSTATDVPLALPEHPLLLRRNGRLNQKQMEQLIKHKQINVLVDATHPFAVEAQVTAKAAATATAVLYLRWQRKAEQHYGVGIVSANTHQEAAKAAISFDKPVLLTTGSRNLLPYTEAANSAGVLLFARVLPHPESELACQKAGLLPEQVIAARGPFSVADNISLINRHGIGVLVTKESGTAGGLPEKLAAAEQSGCQVVMVRQSEQSQDTKMYETVEELVATLALYLEQP